MALQQAQMLLSMNSLESVNAGVQQNNTESFAVALCHLAELHAEQVGRWPGQRASGTVQALPFLSSQSVQLLSCVRLFATPWIAARQGSLSITNSRSSLTLTSIESVMPSSHLILCCPLLCPQSLPASESFPMSQLIAWGGQSTEVSASASLPPKKSQYFYNYNVIRFIRILSSQIKMCFMIALCDLFWDLMKIPVQMQSYVTEMSDSRLKCSVLLELSKVLKKTLSSV